MIKQKSKTTRYISLFLAAVLSVSLMAGCGNKNEGNTSTTDNSSSSSTTTDTSSSTSSDTSTATTDTSAEETPAETGPGWAQDTSPVTFDWYVHFSWYPSFEWGSTLISNYVKEKTGVSINFIVPAGSEAEKLNTMLAADSLPDLVTLGWYEEGVRKMTEDGMVYSLNELADQYDPYFYEVANQQILDWYKKEDGLTYGYPNFSVAPSEYGKVITSSNQTFVVRKDMYEAIGSPDMRTPEGFLGALQAAKDMFPTVDGQPLIPFGTHEFGETGCYSFEGYLRNFLAIPMDENGKLKDPHTDPEYIRWLKTFRQANEMGLISKDIFIDKRAQMEEKIAQGRYFSMLYQRSDMVSGQQALWDKDPNTAYMAIDAISNSNGDAPRLAGPGISGWTLTLISKNCKNPDRAIRFMSYWISEEGQRDFYLGKEGETWDMVGGQPTMKEEYATMLQTNRSEHDKVVGQDPLWMLGNSAIQDQWRPEMAPSLKQMYDWTLDKCVSYSQFDNIDPPADSDLGAAGKKAGEKFGLVLPKLIMAASDDEFDQLFNQFIEERNALQFDELQAYKQNLYEQNKAKLGL